MGVTDMKEDRRDTTPEAGDGLTAGEADDGCRVDALLSRLVPGMGVRGRRRFLKEGRALLNGRPVKAGTAVRAGDRLEIVPLELSPSAMPEARLLARRVGFCVFFKPALLHTVALAGSGEEACASLEGQITGLLGGENCCLLQRLDFATSGLVCGATDKESASLFRTAEREGRVKKCYVCLMEGRVTKDVQVRRRLVSSGGATVHALPEDDPDPVRSTFFHPLFSFTEAECRPEGSRERMITLAGCVIHRGFRHQIRAHAASLGLPLYGDTLYGGKTAGLGLPFYLHHGFLSFAGMSFSVSPDWELASFIQKKACKWFTECARKD